MFTIMSARFATLLGMLLTFTVTNSIVTKNHLSDFSSLKPSSTSTWKAKQYKPIINLSINEIRAQYLGVLGILNDTTTSIKKSLLPPTPHKTNYTSYDWRNSSCIGNIQDQGRCGSCWAVSAVEVYGDRYCISQQRKKNMKAKRIKFSALDLVACDKLCKFITRCCRGCAGGYPSLAWEYIQRKGVVTDVCMPYNLTKSLLCPVDYCLPPLSNKVYKVKHYEKIYGGANAIKNELVQNGPVQATFYVYEDFMHYHSGIYKHQNGRLLGLHAVKIVGFNKSYTASNTTSYWIVANSWGTQWGGMGGYFYIAENECAFEEDVYTGTPLIE